MSLAMVVGTVVGSGIYLLPTTLAPLGPNLVIAFLITGAGTMCLALTLARLAAVLPGGPFAYVAQAFGDQAAFVTLWSYLVSQWVGVAAVAIATAGALGHVLPAAGQGSGLIVTSLAVIGLLTAINLRGARSAGALQVAATLIKLVPLFAVLLLVAARWSGGASLEPLAPIPLGLPAIVAAGALMLFALTGFEAAAVTARVTANPTSTVPFSTIAGTGFTALLYLLSTVAVLMLLPSVTAAASAAPFADAIAPSLGAVAGTLVAVIAAVSAFGTCNALMLLAAEVGRTLAADRSLPTLFARENAAGAPIGGLLVAAGIAALLVLASASRGFIAIYTFMTLLSSVAALILYVLCTAAALKLGTVRGVMAGVALLGIAYAVAMFFGAGLAPTLWGLALAAAGLPIRWLSRRFSASSPAADAAAAPRAPAA